MQENYILAIYFSKKLYFSKYGNSAPGPQKMNFSENLNIYEKLSEFRF